MALRLCRICGVPMESATAQQRGCCDVPRAESLEEQLSFWLDHDPERLCVECVNPECERRLAHV